MGRIIHVELTSADPRRAAEFYCAAFGWQSEASPFADGYLLAATGEGDGIDAAIMSRDHQAQAAIVWLRVDDLEASRTAVVAAGGSVVGEPQEIPGQGWVAYVRDPEGVLLGLRQPG
ncbi:VOC family protein [Kribbella italica]|uniref:Putative enzyme related to lactoylglutathione lyase n=1 Tax=Kribbella italica TaxID=1540520 RepID=A0A7W9MV49_9ACTN|nr:VOC family protein [Kribbella italica]MBB5837434.1 putative enzyme related to lactoylglutathione lyase [Kribbella italica]